jgi:hypothetical protein
MSKIGNYRIEMQESDDYRFGWESAERGEPEPEWLEATATHTIRLRLWAGRITTTNPRNRPMSSDLVERLRAEITWQYLPRFMGTGGMVTPPDEVQLVNPDGPEAADRITELEAAFNQTLEDYAAAVEAREAFAVEVKAKDAVIAGLVRALMPTLYTMKKVFANPDLLFNSVSTMDAFSEAMGRIEAALAKAKESRDAD